MEIVYKSKYYQIQFDKETKLLQTAWVGNNERITDEEIKSLILKLYEFYLELRPSYILNDERGRRFSYAVHIQTWIQKSGAEIYEKIAIKQIAILLPEELIAQLSVTMMVDEGTEKSLEANVAIKYFTVHEDATQWFGL